MHDFQFKKKENRQRQKIVIILKSQGRIPVGIDSALIL